MNSTTDESWDYFDLLAKESQFWDYNMNSEDANLNAREEKEIEMVVLNDLLENFFTIEELNVEIDCLSSLSYMKDEYKTESLSLMVEEELPVEILGINPLEKSLVNVASTPIDSLVIQELVTIEPIDFLGVDNFDLGHHHRLVDLVNNSKINLIHIKHLVELKFLKRLRSLKYSKYLILWNGHVQFLTKSLKWSGMCTIIALISVIESNKNVVIFIMFCYFYFYSSCYLIVLFFLIFVVLKHFVPVWYSQLVKAMYAVPLRLGLTVGAWLAAKNLSEPSDLNF